MLADNEAARISQCPCGTVHVLIRTSGLTVQLTEQRFQQVGLAVMGAVSALGSKSQGTAPSGTRETIN